MGAWDAYIGNNATGDNTYMNQKLVHTKDPFQNYGDDTHAYAVYKILYDAVADGLIEDDFATTDWEGCKGMINNGEIGCMVLGSWAYPQMEAAGENGADIGYMPFPITVMVSSMHPQVLITLMVSMQMQQMMKKQQLWYS